MSSRNLNSNDYKILTCIVDKGTGRGLSKGKGSTIAQIIESTNFSHVKVRETIKILLEMGLIGEGVKKVKARAYYITEKGVQELQDVRKSIEF